MDRARAWDVVSTLGDMAGMERLDSPWVLEVPPAMLHPHQQLQDMAMVSTLSRLVDGYLCVLVLEGGGITVSFSAARK